MRSHELGALEQALGPHRFRLSATERNELESSLSLDTDQLLRSLVSYAKLRARVPISDFRVGAVGLTEAGEVFLGVNLEYAEAGFSETVHAEQFLVSWSRSCSASPLVSLAVSAPPCGHCRQFLREFDLDGAMALLIAEENPVQAACLLPQAFTPRDLGVEASFYSPPLDLSGLNDLEEAARRAALASYAPYSGRPTGLAVRCLDGRLFAGSALENAAYNPSLPPFQAALIACHAHGVEPTEIESVVLCQGGEEPVDYSCQSAMLAQALGITRFRVVSL